MILNITQHLQGAAVYLSGAISSDPDYAVKFGVWEKAALGFGARRVLNPALLPPGWTYDEYMETCMILVRSADVVLLLPGWETSPGARAEKAYAESLQRTVIDTMPIIKIGRELAANTSRQESMPGTPSAATGWNESK